ncbi:MAG: hypothetical protein RJB38_584 [Pseudomonadota bacterium]|jgi:hypothetical protein
MKIRKSFGWSLLFILSSAVALAASGICTGQIVYGNNGSDLVGQVTNVFGKKAEIRWQLLDGQPYSGNLSYWDTEDLSAQTRCFGSVCEGNTVYGNNGSDLVGTANRVFENGKVEVKWALLDGQSDTGGFSYWNAASLSVQTSCSGRICAQDNVYGNNGSNLVGVAQRVFSNGKVEVRWTTLDGAPYSGNLSYWNSSSLQKLAPPCGSNGAAACQ